MKHKLFGKTSRQPDAYIPKHSITVGNGFTAPRRDVTVEFKPARSGLRIPGFLKKR